MVEFSKSRRESFAEISTAGKRGEQPDREPCLSKIVVNLLGQKELMSRELRGHFNFVLGCDLTNDAVVCNDLF